MDFMFDWTTTVGGKGSLDGKRSVGWILDVAEVTEPGLDLVVCNPRWTVSWNAASGSTSESWMGDAYWLFDAIVEVNKAIELIL
jgi:hypothetical protein